MTNGERLAAIADAQRIAPRTLEQVTEAMAAAINNKAADAMARLMMRHGRLVPEAYRYLESFLVECPKCGLLNGHRFPCVS